MKQDSTKGYHNIQLNYRTGQVLKIIERSPQGLGLFSLEGVPNSLCEIEGTLLL